MKPILFISPYFISDRNSIVIESKSISQVTLQDYTIVSHIPRHCDHKPVIFFRFPSVFTIILFKGRYKKYQVPRSNYQYHSLIEHRVILVFGTTVTFGSLVVFYFYKMNCKNTNTETFTTPHITRRYLNLILIFFFSSAKT